MHLDRACIESLFLIPTPCPVLVILSLIIVYLVAMPFGPSKCEYPGIMLLLLIMNFLQVNVNNVPQL